MTNNTSTESRKTIKEMEAEFNELEKQFNNEWFENRKAYRRLNDKAALAKTEDIYETLGGKCKRAVISCDHKSKKHSERLDKAKTREGKQSAALDVVLARRKELEIQIDAVKMAIKHLRAI